EFDVDGDTAAEESPAAGEQDAASEQAVSESADTDLGDTDIETEVNFDADLSTQESHDVEPSPEPEAETEKDDAEAPEAERADTGTVVGNVQSSNEVLSERTSTVGGVKVTPAVRALARKLKIDLTRVESSGPDGIVTAADVRRAAESGQATAAPRDTAPAATRAPEEREPAPAPTPEQQPGVEARAEPSPPSGDWEPIRGTRRTMARVMSDSHKQVVPTSLMDDADIQAWRPGEDITARLLRALWAGAQAEPGLNAWYDGENNLRMRHKNLHVGMAVDTPDGLFVAALRNVNRSDRAQLRSEINRLRDNVANRSIPPEDLKDYTIVLSNFGKFAGRYATPVVTPPCVAIVAAGKLRHEVVPVLGGMEVHRIIPISLTFDHRACTGGEAARFLKAMLDDLARAE
ncbi:MAG: dihydrolipoamide acetyltransferase family protein, partial [Wenzhouxiangella sp.]|nr:dihydrolipoamide acetyltransferase family protein [Wenzhouxiangella sp.]